MKVWSKRHKRWTYQSANKAKKKNRKVTTMTVYLKYVENMEVCSSSESSAAVVLHGVKI